MHFKVKTCKVQLNASLQSLSYRTILCAKAFSIVRQRGYRTVRRLVGGAIRWEEL